jgi:hypothetical protein
VNAIAGIGSTYGKLPEQSNGCTLPGPAPLSPQLLVHGEHATSGIGSARSRTPMSRMSGGKSAMSCFVSSAVRLMSPR